MAQKTKQEIKTRIIISAERLFTRKGYEKTSISEIMHNCNLAAGTFYVYFNDKRSLLEEIFDPFLYNIETLFQLSTYPEPETASQFFRNFSREVIRFSEFSSKFKNELKFLLKKSHNTKYDFFINQIEKMIYNEIERYITYGISRLYIREAHIPAFSKICAHIIINMMNLIVDDDGSDEGIIVEETLAILINGIRRNM